jgi:hypothetical protein
MLGGYHILLILFKLTLHILLAQPNGKEEHGHGQSTNKENKDIARRRWSPSF